MKAHSGFALRAAVFPLLLSVPTLVPPAGRALAPAPGERVVRYGAVAVKVPRGWPVYDLSRDPHRCVRLDVHAVYLGPAGPDQDCPAHVVGRTEAVWIAPSDSTAGPATAIGDAVVRSVSGQRARVVVTYGADRAAAVRIARSATADRPVAPTMAAAAWQAPATTPMASTSGRSTLIGQAFDACAAPSVSVMKSWVTASPYRGANIYIGGAVRACAQPNLTATWVGDVQAMGWRLIPTYVGLQAPCDSSFSSSQRMSSNTTTAAAQGKSAADDAAKIATALGLPSGSPVYFDVEPYTRSSSCSASVLSFLASWTQELHATGWSAGAYGAETSLIPDLESKVGTGYVEPDDIWVANWNNLDSVLGDPAVSDRHWSAHQRIHQWHGAANESYGGYTVNIDANAVDGQVAGAAGGACAAYPAETFGPNSCTGPVAFNGPMQYWRLGAPGGLDALERWTYGNGSTEADGATWRPSLGTKGTYQLSAWIPSTHATANATYTVTDVAGTHAVTVNQSTHHGSWVTLGTYSTGASGSITAHVGDAVSTSSVVAADAMKFHLVQPLDTAPPSGTLTSPASGTWSHPGAPVTLSGSFSDDTSVTKVAFFVSNGSGTWQAAGTDTHAGQGTYSVTWPEAYADGAVVSVRADAYDTAGRMTSFTVTDALQIDGVAPTARMTAPTTRYTIGTGWDVKWAGSDSASGIAGWDVRKRATSFAGTRSSWSRLVTGAPAATVTASFSGAKAGYDYCFEVRAHDRAGNLSAWSSPACRAVAADDHALSVNSSWSRYSNWSGYYQTTFTQTTRYLATATASTSTATQVTLLATTCSDCGRVRIFIGGTSVGTVSLQASSWHRHQWRSVPMFAGRTGALTLRVVSSGKLVRIDAFAIATQ